MSDNPKGTALAIALATRAPVILWGDPGTGKSSAVVQLAKDHGLPCEVVIASIRDPTDFSGLPVPQPDGTVRMAAPAWAKRLADAPKGGVLFLDEISTAPPAVQAALLRVVLDKVVGDQPLGDKVAIIAAANPPESAAGGWELTPPLANRFVHLDWEPLSVEDWGKALVSGKWPTPNGVGRLPDGWEDEGAFTKALVAGFLNARPTHLLRLPKAESEAGRAWPSPRSWESLSRLVTAAKAVGAGFEIQAVLATGCVGAGVGSEFLAYLREANLPDPKYLLEHPETFKMPDRGDLIYAVLTGVADLASKRPNEQRVVNAWRIFGVAAKEKSADLGAASAQALARATKPEWMKKAEGDIKAYAPLLKAAGLLPGAN